MFAGTSSEEVRNICRRHIEALEMWLRRLIHEELLGRHGKDYLNCCIDDKGNRLIGRKIVCPSEKRFRAEPDRYARLIDAALLEDLADIICNPPLYERFFREGLKEAFPEGNEEARTFIRRILEPRNRLAHANPISLRQAEQVVCYSNDIIASLKQFYTEKNVDSEYNVPLLPPTWRYFGTGGRGRPIVRRQFV